MNELFQAMSEDANALPPQDKLDRITAKMREARDLKEELQELEDKLKQKKAQLLNVTHRELPDMMNEVGQQIFKLQAEGNHRPYLFNLKPYYMANISNENPDAPKAYQWLEERGEGDLIRRTVTANLGKDSEELYNRVVDFLQNLQLDYDYKFGIPWKTLTAWLKERHKQYVAQRATAHLLPPEERIDMPPLEWFGATIGQVAEMKESK